MKYNNVKFSTTALGHIVDIQLPTAAYESVMSFILQLNIQIFSLTTVMFHVAHTKSP